MKGGILERRINPNAQSTIDNAGRTITTPSGVTSEIKTIIEQLMTDINRENSTRKKFGRCYPSSKQNLSS